MTAISPIAHSDGHRRERMTIELVVSPAPEEIGRLRAILANGPLRHLHADDLTDVLLVVSELMTNAIQASPRNEKVRVVVARTDTAVVVVVENRARLDVASLSYELPPADQLAGRGLAVVHVLASDLDVRSQLGQTVVRAVVLLRNLI